MSLDHYTAGRHEEERGVDTFAPTKDGLIWLTRNGFNIAVAGRAMWREDEAAQRAGYARLFAEHDIPIDANNSGELVLFPEMDVGVDVPEILPYDQGRRQSVGPELSQGRIAKFPRSISSSEKNHGLRFEGILKIEFASKQLPVQKSANSIT